MNQRYPMAKRPRSAMSGFTLAEVMIVVVIVGILFSFALPSYRESMNKGRRSDAKSALMDVANRQERLLLDRSTYTTDMTDLGFTSDPMISEEGHYSVDTVACGAGTIATCYTITATARAGQAQATDTACSQFVLQSTGAKSATSATCW